jgi:hypothetical protein
MMLMATRCVGRVRSCGRVVESHGKVVVGGVVQWCSERRSIMVLTGLVMAGKLSIHLHDGLFPSYDMVLQDSAAMSKVLGPNEGL